MLATWTWQLGCAVVGSVDFRGFLFVDCFKRTPKHTSPILGGPNFETNPVLS